MERTDENRRMEQQMKTFKQHKSEKESWLTSKRQQFWNAMDEKKKREDDAAKDEKKDKDK
jgi:ribosomal protein S21